MIGLQPDGLRRSYAKVAAMGGIYSNHLALAAALADARSQGAELIVCLGDLGAFGPSPDKVFPLVQAPDIVAIRGNYDDSIARGLDDCQCGYTDPMDNHFARLSYQYTFRKTSPVHRAWLGALPSQYRLTLGRHELLACHGSPRQMNEFLWESTTPTHFLEKLATEHQADLIVGTHTGIHWERVLGEGRRYVNAGALGRPANDGRTEVWYAMLEAQGDDVDVSFRPVAYDHETLAAEMSVEGLPEEFIETIESGWWTTCLEVLPGKERAAGRY
ncbi:MAG: metallophosphoesterase family protein [Longimicrobiales bacterium]